MNKLIIYFTIYIILILILHLFLKEDVINFQGIELNTNTFLILSLAIPFLIMIQYIYELLFNTNNSIVLNVIGILIALSVSILVLFYIIKITFPYLFSTKTIFIIVSIISFILLFRTIKNDKITSIINFLKNNLYSFLITLHELPLNSKFIYGIIFTVFIISIISIHSGGFINTFFMPKNTRLLTRPVYLNKNKSITSNENTSIKQITERNNNKINNINNLEINYNYALKFSLYLNPQGGNTRTSYNKFTKIIDYGDNPTIYFNPNTTTFQLSFNNGENNNIKNNIFFKVNIDDNFFYQKWNTLLINFKGGTIDIFINGKLIKHAQIVPKYRIENITVGENNGLEGGIKNVVYYNTPLKLYQIHLLEYL